MRIKRSRENELDKKIEKRYTDNSSNIVIGIFILLFGIMLGITINSNSTFALDTASSNNATAPNATDHNATDSNATDHNATDSNATDHNATASNAVNTDNIIYLNDISLSKNAAKAGEKVFVNKSTSGACNTAMNITFKEVTTGVTFSANIEDLNNNAYITIPNNVVSGNYEVSNLFVVGLNSDNTTFTKKYINSNNNTDNNSFNFNIKINITGNEKDKVELNKLSLSNTSAKVGDKVSINVSTTKKISSLKLVFKSNKNNTFDVYANDLSSNAYIVIPSSVKSDNYYGAIESLFVKDQEEINDKKNKKGRSFPNFLLISVIFCVIYFGFLLWFAIRSMSVGFGGCWGTCATTYGIDAFIDVFEIGILAFVMLFWRVLPIMGICIFVNFIRKGKGSDK